MGWLALALVGAGAGVILWAAGAPRALAALLGAAMLLGATGYALQGRPELAAKPAAAQAESLQTDPGLVEFRAAILGDRHRAAMTMADRALERGDRRAAVRILLDLVRRAPRDAGAWTMLGTVLAAHDGGQLSPSARLAFARAAAIDPQASGPPFFLGLALINAGEIDAARRAWRRALALTPATAPYRQDIALRLGLVERFAAMMQGAPGAPR